MLWDDLTRDELVAEKGRWESKLRDINLTLQTARRRAAAGHGFLPLPEIEALEAERRKTAGCVTALQGRLTRIKASKQRTDDESFDARFRAVAKLILEEDLYDEIYQGAVAVHRG